MKLQEPTTRPGIYILFFIDPSGLGPSATEWEELLQLAELYASDGAGSNMYATETDQQHGRPVSNAQYTDSRKYLLTPADGFVTQRSLFADVDD